MRSISYPCLGLLAALSVVALLDPMGATSAQPTTAPVPTVAPTVGQEMGVYNVRNFGAVGDGKALDSPAINKAIEAAAAAGGGTVLFPPGIYRCFSIRLKSNICLNIGQSATILAADNPPKGEPGYDPPEGDWEFLVVSPDGLVEAPSPLPLCARCHAEAPHDHLFGGAR